MTHLDLGCTSCGAGEVLDWSPLQELAYLRMDPGCVQQCPVVPRSLVALDVCSEFAAFLLDLRFVSACTRLRALDIGGCNAVRSLAPLNALKQLEVVYAPRGICRDADSSVRRTYTGGARFVEDRSPSIERWLQM